MATKIELNKQAKEIIKIAEKNGVEANYFFVTTFNRYLMQLDILKGLEDSIKNDGLLVNKEYVKGRKNLYSSPAVKEYNRTTDSANKTVATLMKIIKNFNVADGEDEEIDPLLEAINGGEIDE